MENQKVLTDNRGILIGLVLLFQTQIKDIVNSALNSISSGADKIIKPGA